MAGLKKNGTSLNVCIETPICERLAWFCCRKISRQHFQGVYSEGSSPLLIRPLQTLSP